MRDTRTSTTHPLISPPSSLISHLSSLSWQYTLFPEPIGESDSPHKPRLVDSRDVSRIVQKMHACVSAHRVPPPRQLGADGEAQRPLNDAGEERRRRIIRRDGRVGEAEVT